MAPFRWISDIIAKMESYLVATALLAMIGLAFLQVLLRNIWDTGLSWGDPVVRALVLWVGFLGASLATRQGSHIRFDVISKFLPRRWHRITGFFISLVSATVCILLTKAAYKFIVMEKEVGSMLVAQIPNWVCLLIIPISFIIMAFRFLIEAFTGPPTESTEIPMSLSHELKGEN